MTFKVAPVGSDDPTRRIAPAGVGAGVGVGGVVVGPCGLGLLSQLASATRSSAVRARLGTELDIIHLRCIDGRLYRN
jgi:hypothetical protein